MSALLGFVDLARTARATVLCLLARTSSARAGVALVYHRVGGRTSGDPKREILPTVTADVFAGQLRHLRRHYRIVPASDLFDAVRRRRRWERFPVSITFDDDLSGHLREAAPLLRSARATATFFLGGVSLDGPHPFWWEDLQQAVDRRLVSAGDVPHVADEDLVDALERAPRAIFRVAGSIQELERPQRNESAAALRAAVGEPPDVGLRTTDVEALAAEFEIGFHTFAHDALPALGDEALAEALRDGRDALERAVGKPLRVLSYPHGKADARVAAAARDAGFTFAFVTARAPVTPATSPWLLPRIPPALSVGKTALRVARAVMIRAA